MRVFLTGASTGIGAAFARRKARPGAVIGLVARRRALLDELAASLQAAGAQVEVYAEDVADTAAMRAAAEHFLAAAGGVDLVLANAGIAIPNPVRSGDAEAAAQLFRVNVIGASNSVLPFVPAMLAQGAGVLAAVGSIAGFRALPGRGVYSASKAAVKTLMDAIRLDLRGSGVHAMTICPGFVRTPMTDSLSGKLPFLVEVDDAAARIEAAIDARRDTFTFPLPMAALKELWTRVPEPWLPHLVKAAPSRD